MELTEGDREAFHSQADKISDAVDFKEVDRQDKERAVRSVFMTLNEDGEGVMVILKVLPRHRFLVDVVGGGLTRTTRRDDAIDAIQDAVS